MRLTKRDRTTLQNALNRIESARLYLDSERVAVCRRSDVATTTLHYSNASGGSLYPVEKWIGSDLAQLDTGIQALGHFLATH